MGVSLQIGLHSQTLFDFEGLVAGSEVTTNGLANAFLRHPDKHQVVRFSPNNYDLVSKVLLDLVIIEGWHPELPYFISLLRKFNPKVVVIFWNLSFYGFNGVVKLDVDGYFTNSMKNLKVLNWVKPTKYLMLAADVDFFKYEPNKVASPSIISYLGMYHPSKSLKYEERLLHEAADFNLQIFGHGWENNDKLNLFAKGVLPIDKISELYQTSAVVLAITEDRQRRFGMINNRIFESLACGACLISEHFEALEQTFGDMIFYSKEIGDTKTIIESILSNPTTYIEHGYKVSSYIKENHTYSHRVEEVLEFYHTLL